MEISVKTKEEYQEISYPCLMYGECSGDKYIILFTAPKTGTVIVDEATDGFCFEPGHYDDDWDMGQFKPFFGEITIKS